MEKSGDSASFWQWPGFSRQILVVRLRPWTSYLLSWQKACNLELQALWGQLSAAVHAWTGRGNPSSWPCEGSAPSSLEEEESETPAIFANVWVLNVISAQRPGPGFGEQNPRHGYEPGKVCRAGRLQPVEMNLYP